MVSGQDFADSQYNIATHPVGRQTGSTFKVITLATALANGYSPERHRRRAEPRAACRSSSATPSTDQLGRRRGRLQRLWARDRRTRSTARSCASSTSVGQDKVIAMAHKMGITQDRPRPAHLTLSLGTSRQNTARDGHGDGHHRQRRRAPHALLRAEGRRRPTATSSIDESNQPPRRPGARPRRRRLRAERAARRGHRRHRHQGQRRRPRALRQDRHHRQHAPTRGSSARTPQLADRGVVRQPHRPTVSARASVATRRRRSCGRS